MVDMKRLSRIGPARLSRATTAIVLAALFSVITGSDGLVSAHDEIESSVPAHQSQFDDPISEVTIQFGEPVGGIELALVGPDNEELGGTVERLSDTSARLTFPPLPREGEYLVRYLAEEDGHLVNGAISFVYGSRDGTGAGTSTWLLFGIVAVALLAIGSLWTWKLSRRLTDDDEPEPQLA